MYIAEFEQQPDTPEKSLIDLISDLDTARTTLFLASDRYADLPTDKRFQEFVVATRHTNVALAIAVSYILNEDASESIDTKAKLVTTLLSEDDSHRVDFYNTLFGDNKFVKADYLQNDHVAQVINLLYQINEIDDPDEQPDASAIILDRYFNGANLDSERVASLASNSKKAKALRVAQKVGKKSVELGLVAGAAALGARLATRDRQ